MVAASYCAGRGVVVIDVNASGTGRSVAVLPSVHLVWLLQAEELIDVEGLARLLMLMMKLMMMLLLLVGLILTRMVPATGPRVILVLQCLWLSATPTATVIDKVG